MRKTINKEVSAAKTNYGLRLFIMAGILLLGIIISITLGRYSISLAELGQIIFGAAENNADNAQTAAILFEVRLPRIILACLVGCCLSAAGAAYQGVFQNPMAAPDILGASSSSAFGAALAILLGLGSTMVTGFAFIAGILGIFAVLFISGKARGKKVVGLVLCGMMVSSLFSSATSIIKLVADPNDALPEITYWLMGSLAKTGTQELLFVIAPMAIGLITLFVIRWRINLLTLSDDEASTMGIAVKKIRIVVILAATLITAAAVSVSGMIGWIGLIIPHMARRIVGSNFKYLMPASMLMGSIFLLLVDNISRNMFATEIPIGILTSFIGAPFFIWLIIRRGEAT